MSIDREKLNNVNSCSGILHNGENERTTTTYTDQDES